MSASSPVWLVEQSLMGKTVQKEEFLQSLREHMTLRTPSCEPHVSLALRETFWRETITWQSMTFVYKGPGASWDKFFLLLSELVRLRVGSTSCTLNRSVRNNFDTKQPGGPRSIIVYKLQPTTVNTSRTKTFHFSPKEIGTYECRRGMSSSICPFNCNYK